MVGVPNLATDAMQVIRTNCTSRGPILPAGPDGLHGLRIERAEPEHEEGGDRSDRRHPFAELNQEPSISGNRVGARTASGNSMASFAGRAALRITVCGMSANSPAR